jgi:fumarylpyruvate hydrolase
MTDVKYVVDVPEIVGVPVLNSAEFFPVRRIYCVGRNYAEHIREMGGDERQPPFFFQKPTDSIVLDGAEIPYPTITSDFQHEIELVMAIGKGGANITQEDAGEHVFGVAVGVDLTRRDVQVEARKAGRPWEIGKSFDKSAPIGIIHPLQDGKLPTAGEINIAVNGVTKQTGDLSQMIWNCSEVISALSKQYRLEPGDLIYTGTPAGVAPLAVGDVVEGNIAGLTPLRFSIVQA